LGVDEMKYRVPLSIVSADSPTVGDVSNTFRKAHQITSGSKGNLVLTASDGIDWYQYTASDEELLIQELGLSGPVVDVTLSNEKYQIFLNTLLGKTITFAVYAFTTVRHLSP
jgi:hypothetical protein